MKTMLSAALMILSTESFASIINSDYEKRHQQVIESAIASECQIIVKNLTQILSKEEVIRVDNGVEDIHFTTVLKGLRKIDQGVFDNYKITVKSTYSDSYDHNSGDWGAYTVQSIKCEME